MPNPTKTFSEIQIGRRFKTRSGVEYKKSSSGRAVIIKDKKGNIIRNGKETHLFKDSKAILEIIN